MVNPEANPQRPLVRTVRDLALDLLLAREPQARGNAIFLIGAGCSVSAGVKLASGVARHCAAKLALKYSDDSFAGDADQALEWLIANESVRLSNDQTPKDDGSHWPYLYQYFFEEHLKSPNQQRDVINDIIDEADDRLNWAHACLGELVNQRYVHTVLTTNFDQLVLQGIIRTGLLPVVADGLEVLNRITAKPRRPQVVHLHGSMHTYNLRNSREAVVETAADLTAQSMMFSLLQGSSMLVVVGYAGAEDGVMRLLRDASKTMPQSVIYWVTYEGGADKLSEPCTELLSGENKFIVQGGEADDFFSEVMRELKIGQPAWVRDPIAVLSKQSLKLQAPSNIADVGFLVAAFRERVKHADLPENRWPERDAKTLAAEKSAQGDFEGARALLEPMDRNMDDEAAALHAHCCIKIFEADPTSHRHELDSAIDELGKLVERTKDEGRLEHIEELTEAYLDLHDFPRDENEASTSIQNLLAMIGAHQNEFSRDANAAGFARLKFVRARALQIVSEQNSENTAQLDECISDYREVIGVLAAIGDPRNILVEAKSGLAAALQVSGERSKDQPKLREAVVLQREVVEMSRSNSKTKEDAGQLANLAEALQALAVVVAPDEATLLLAETVLNLRQAISFYEREGETERIKETKEVLAEVEAKAAQYSR
jgi:hypothetical protein